MVFLRNALSATTIASMITAVLAAANNTGTGTVPVQSCSAGVVTNDAGGAERRESSATPPRARTPTPPAREPVAASATTVSADDIVANDTGGAKRAPSQSPPRQPTPPPKRAIDANDPNVSTNYVQSDDLDEKVDSSGSDTDRKDLHSSGSMTPGDKRLLKRLNARGTLKKLTQKFKDELLDRLDDLETTVREKRGWLHCLSNCGKRRNATIREAIRDFLREQWVKHRHTCARVSLEAVKLVLVGLGIHISMSTTTNAIDFARKYFEHLTQCSSQAPYTCPDVECNVHACECLSYDEVCKVEPCPEPQPSECPDSPDCPDQPDCYELAELGIF